MTGAIRSIPRRTPRLVFEREVPKSWFGFYETPVASPEVVLLACGWGDDRDLAERRPALIALDARTGAERFRLEVPVLRPGATEGQVSPAAVLPDGRVLVAVYQWDAALTVHLLGCDGRVERADEIGEEGRMVELDLYGADSGVKLFLGRPVVAGDAYLVSWVYRGRSQHLMARSLQSGAPLWERDEWLLACAGGVAIGETDPPLRVRPTGAEVVGPRAGGRPGAVAARARVRARGGRHDRTRSAAGPAQRRRGRTRPARLRGPGLAARRDAPPRPRRPRRCGGERR